MAASIGATISALAGCLPFDAFLRFGSAASAVRPRFVRFGPLPAEGFVLAVFVIMMLLRVLVDLESRHGTCCLGVSHQLPLLWDDIKRSVAGIIRFFFCEASMAKNVASKTSVLQKTEHHEHPMPVSSDRGLICRHCGGRCFRVIYTRAAPEAKIIRRRECTACGKRLTTWERAIGVG